MFGFCFAFLVHVSEELANMRNKVTRKVKVRNMGLTVDARRNFHGASSDTHEGSAEPLGMIARSHFRKSLI